MLHRVDFLVVAAYAAVVIILGWMAHRRQSSSTDYFLGGRNLPWLVVGASILATAFSASSLLGGPGEAFHHGLLWLQLQVGDLIAVAIVVYFFIPALRGRELTTAYEFLESRFDLRVRWFASALFQLQVLFRAGVLVYGPALALSTLTDLNLSSTIVIVGAVAAAYTVLGGITAVVWTDALQVGVVVAGLGACLAQIHTGMDGGLAEAFSIASEAGRTRLVDTAAPLNSARSWPGAVFGYGILALAVFGTNQQTVQRYLSCRSVAEARRAAWTGWFLGLLITALTLVLGVALYGYYRVHTGALDSEIAADAILPFFVANELPPGLAGLLVAAILAAAMSSLDSALSSLATTCEVDFLSRLRPTDDAGTLRRARWLTLIAGILATAAALALAGRGTLLALAVRVMGWFAGPILAIFILALRKHRPPARVMLVAAVLGTVVVLLASIPGPWPEWARPGIWSAALGTVVTLAIAVPFVRRSESS
ncbi:sodium-coupled permease [bacterium]|nr:MAG: sodium-coupled permease [bacterium]